MFGQEISNAKNEQRAAWLFSTLFMQPTVRSGDAFHRLAVPLRRAPFGRLNRSWLRYVLPQGKMGSGPVIVIEIRTKGSSQRAIMENDHMSDALGARRPN